MILTTSIIMLICFILFWLSFRSDKRKLLNGLLFNIFLLSVMLELTALIETPLKAIGYGFLVIAGILFVLLLLFGIYIIIGLLFWNARIIRKREGHNLANALTFLLAIGLTGLAIVSWLNPAQYFPAWLGNLFGLVPAMIFYLLICFFNFFTASILYQFNRPKPNQKYIIVLGAGLINGERVTPLLAQRIDAALAFYQKQQLVTTPPKLILSGGQGADEKISEAQAMKNYVLEQNIPENQIILEDASTNTYQNMLFSKKIILQQNVQNVPTLFATNNYHLFRAGLFARKVGLNATGIGAKTAFYYLPTATIREFLGVLSLHRKRHIIMTSLIVALYVALALLVLFIK